MNDGRIRIDRTQVREHFSCHAADYDRYALVQQRVAGRLVALLPERVRGARQLALEVGCGTGLLSRQIEVRYPDMTLILSDLAHGMCCHVKHRFPAFPVLDADANILPFRAESIDLAISSSVYQWIDDLPAAFSEVSRVLKPGGMFALAMFGEKTLYELRSSHQWAVGSKPSHGQSFASKDAVAKALPDSLDLDFLCSEYEIEWHAGVRELLRNLKRIGAQNASSERPSGFASRQVMQRMIDYYQQEYSTREGVPATYEVVYLLARKRGGGDRFVC